MTVGFAQRLVTPWMVSGRRVAVRDEGVAVPEHDERELDHLGLVAFEQVVVADRVVVHGAVPDRVGALDHVAGLVQVLPLPLDELAVVSGRPW